MALYVDSAYLKDVKVDPARVGVKVPMSALGVKAALALAHESIRAAQVYCGELAGAAWIIPYFDRLRRSGVDACQVIADMARVMSKQPGATRLLAASVKSPGDVVEADTHDVAAPLQVIRELTEDALYRVVSHCCRTETWHDASRLNRI